MLTSTHRRTTASGTLDVAALVPDALPPSVGERNASARMTAEKVRALRVAADAGARLAPLAEAFGVDVRTARHIVDRTSWRHVA